MVKKILIGGLLAVVVLFGGLFFWARTVLTGDTVRTALAAQVEKAIGQPVSIGSIDATITPRVTLKLGDVRIGPPGKIVVGELNVGTDFNALLSRRIEHATMTLTQAHLELPLPAFTIASSSTPDAAAPTKPPVELVSIDEIVLHDVEVVSGGRTLRGDIEVQPQGTTGLAIRKIALGADKTTINVTGVISNFTGPVGELTVKAGDLNMEQLLAFVNDFNAGAGLADASATPAPPPTPPSAAAAPGAAAATPALPAGMNLKLNLETDSTSMGGLTLSKLAGTAKIAEDGLTLNPVSFGIFDGQYQGSLNLVPGKTLRFKGSSTLSNIDVALATKFGGSPDTITGRLSGKLDFAGSGDDPATVMKTVAGKARVDITNGIIRNLGLVNAVVTATSMRTGSLTQTATAVKSGPSDEPFTKIGATLDIAGGSVTTSDFAMESKDLLLNAQGIIGLVASTVDLKGRVQLSDELSQQAGRDLLKYTQDQGRVTLPATVSGSLEAPSVKIDVGDMAKRALQNAVNEQKDKAKAQATEAVKKKLGGFFGR